MSVDYLELVKAAARRTWKHKGLWLFGFFVALGSGGGGNYSSNFRGNTSSSEFQSQLQKYSDFDWQAWIPIIIVLAVVGLVVALAIWVLRLISEGALIGMGREIVRGGTPTVGDGFRVGGRYWLRMFGVEFILMLPIALFVIALVIVGIVLLGGSIGLAASSGGGDSAAPAALGGICGFFVLLGVGLIVLIPAGIVLSVWMFLARRRVVLLDDRVFQSLRNGWAMIRSSFKAVGLMWLTMLAVGIVVGIVTAIVGAVLVLPGIFLMIASPVMGAVLLVPGVLILMFVAGVIQAFVSMAWTDFFMQVEPAAA
jgi:hypothetical protein